MTHSVSTRASAYSFTQTLAGLSLSQKLESWSQEEVSFEEKFKRIEALDRFKSFALDPSEKRLDLAAIGLESLPDVFDDPILKEKLEVLDLTGNLLEYLPGTVGSLIHLKKMILSENPKLKALPDTIGSLTALEELFIIETTIDLELEDYGIENRLFIPDSFSTLKKLKRLFVSGYLFDEIPRAVFSCKELRSLSFSTCGLKQMPPELFTVKKLEMLDLSFNEIAEVPSEIRHLKKLESIDLSFNKLTAVAEEIFHLRRLIQVNLEHNPTFDALLEEDLQQAGEVEGVHTSSGTFLEEEMDDSLEDLVSKLYAFIKEPQPKDLLKKINCREFEEKLRGYLTKIYDNHLFNPNRKSYYKAIADALALSSSDASFLNMFSLLLEDALSSCSDRILLTIFQLRIFSKLKKLENENKSSALQYLQKEVFAFELIEKQVFEYIQRKKLEHTADYGKGIHFPNETLEQYLTRKVDPIEIYLTVFYRCQIGLGLDLDLEEVFFESHSGVLDEEVDQIEFFISGKLFNKKESIDFLLRNQNWKDFLDRFYPQKMGQIKRETLAIEDSSKVDGFYHAKMKKFTALVIQIIHEEESKEPIGKRTRSALKV
jgi:Leucine-rich repeat (LRR) protein